MKLFGPLLSFRIWLRPSKSPSDAEHGTIKDSDAVSSEFFGNLTDPFIRMVIHKD
jgi:hypothetical protein